MSASKILKGKVVSAAMKKTVVVAVERYVKHSRYGKYMKITKRYKAHDEKNEHKIGDEIMIQECRPLSRDKKFKVI
ncbi:MAG: 30S ribosomal protein S17 [Candidatus Niyogibacteria bacterium]|nr:30S ribosomal protein S17 [Candidatus Niyogibacteria bacterium]